MTLIDGHTHLFAPGQVAERDEVAGREAAFGEMYGGAEEGGEGREGLKGREGREGREAGMAVVEDLRRAMELAGLDGAVAAGFAFDSESELERQNEYLLSCRGDGISVLATVNPSHKGWEAGARAAVSAGAVGFGELRPGNQGWDPLGDEGRALCALAGELGVALLWHASEPVGHSYPGKLGGISAAELVRVALAFPEVRMVGAHLGAGASFYLQMPELREGIGNLYYDTAASSLLYDERSVARLVEVAGAERVVFGSDFPLQSPKRQIERLRSSLPLEALDAVLGENAETIFRENQA